MLAVTTALVESLRAAATTSTEGGGAAGDGRLWAGCLALGTALGEAGVVPRLLEEDSAEGPHVLGRASEALTLLADQVDRGGERAAEALNLLHCLAPRQHGGAWTGVNALAGGLLGQALTQAGDVVAGSAYVADLESRLQRAQGTRTTRRRRLASELASLLGLLGSIRSLGVEGAMATQLMDRLLAPTGAPPGWPLGDILARDLWGNHPDFARAQCAALSLLLASVERQPQQPAHAVPSVLEVMTVAFGLQVVGRLTDPAVLDGDEGQQVFLPSLERALASLRASRALARVAAFRPVASQLCKHLQEDEQLHARLSHALGKQGRGVPLMHALHLLLALGLPIKPAVTCLHVIVEEAMGERPAVTVLSVLEMAAAWEGVGEDGGVARGVWQMLAPLVRPAERVDRVWAAMDEAQQSSGLTMIMQEASGAAGGAAAAQGQEEEEEEAEGLAMEIDSLAI